MTRFVTVVFFVLSALATGSVVSAHDFTSGQPQAAIEAGNEAVFVQVRSSDINNGDTFVNDANTVAAAQPVAADATGNGFGVGVPQEREYVAPQLVAPQPEVLPQPLPQNAAAEVLTQSASLPDTVGADAEILAQSATTPNLVVADARGVAVDASQPMSQPQTPAEELPRPLAAAASGPPSEERAAIDEEPRPLAVAAAAAPDEAPKEDDIQLVAPMSVPAPVSSTETPEATATEVSTKATNLKSESVSDDTDGDSGAHIATFFAAGAACALVVAGVMIARRRKLKTVKTPGTPKNELTFFHVQAQLTPPHV